MLQDLHSRMTATVTGSPASKDLYCSSTSTMEIPPLSKDLLYCSTSTVVAPPLVEGFRSPSLISNISGPPSFRNSNGAVPLLWKTPTVVVSPLLLCLHCYRTSTVSASPPLYHYPQYCRTSNVSGPLLSLDFHCYRTSNVVGALLQQELHCLWTCTVPASPALQDIFSCLNSIVIATPLYQDSKLQNLHCLRTSTVSVSAQHLPWFNLIPDSWFWLFHFCPRKYYLVSSLWTSLSPCPNLTAANVCLNMSLTLSSFRYPDFQVYL